jgi:hypothetical protein
MARQAGPHFFTGRIGDLIYYKSGDVYLVRRAISLNKNQIKKRNANPKFKESKIEFGGGAVLSKAFRETFATSLEMFNCKKEAGRFTGIFRTIIKNGSEKDGVRKAEILKNKDLLLKFEFHKENVFDYIFKPIMQWEVKKRRKEIALVISTFNPKGSIVAPVGATHFKITLNLGIISDHEFSKAMKKYIPVDASLNGRSFLVDSEEISLEKTVEEIRLSVAIESPVSAACSLIACVGIQFFKEEGGTKYELETKRTMKIAEVF